MSALTSPDRRKVSILLPLPQVQTHIDCTQAIPLSPAEHSSVPENNDDVPEFVDEEPEDEPLRVYTYGWKSTIDEQFIANFCADIGIPKIINMIKGLDGVKGAYLTFGSAEEVEQFMKKVEGHPMVHARKAGKNIQRDRAVNKYRANKNHTVAETKAMARYFEREYIRTEREEDIGFHQNERAKKNKKLKERAEESGYDLAKIACVCKAIRFLGTRNGVPLFGAEWGNTVELIDSFVDANWCWIYAQIVNESKKTIELVYKRFTELAAPPEKCNGKWPLTAEEAFTYSFLEYVENNDVDPNEKERVCQTVVQMDRDEKRDKLDKRLDKRREKYGHKSYGKCPRKF